MDDVLRINQGAPIDAILESARKNTYSMATDALAKPREGRTTLDELRRVLPLSALREFTTTLPVSPRPRCRRSKERHEAGDHRPQGRLLDISDEVIHF